MSKSKRWKLFRKILDDKTEAVKFLNRALKLKYEIKEETFISKAMIIEKTTDTEELSENLNKIIKEITEKPEIYNEEQKELLITIINLALREKLEQEEINEMIKRLEGGRNMLAVVEMVREENKRLIAMGERKAQKI